MYQIGIPLIQASGHALLKRNLLIFLPLSVFVVCGILFLYYRNMASFVLPLLTTSLSVLTTLGFMAYMSYPVTPATVVVLPLVMAFACAESGRMMLTYFDEIRADSSKKDAMLHTVRHDGFPVLIASLTISVGLVGLALSQSTMVKQFGIVGAFSVFANFLITVTIIPGLGQYFPISAYRKKDASHLFIFDLGGRIIQIYERCRFATIGVIIVLIAVALAGIFRLRIDTTLHNIFKQDSLIGQRASAVSTELAGISTLAIIIDTGRENRVKEPEVLRQIDTLQAFIARQPWCDKTISFADYMKMTHREMNGGRKDMEVIPGSRELVSQYLLLLDNVDLKRYVSSDYAAANIVVRHHLNNSQELTAALKTIRDYVNKNMSTDLIVRLTGRELISHDTAGAVIREQLTYLSLAIAVIVLILSVLFLSMKVSIAAMLPTFLTLLFHFGGMGWFAIPLNFGTCMLAVLALALTTGNIVHFLVRYQERLMATNDQELALATTIYHEGEPVFLTSAGLALGFGLFVLSGVPLTIHVGLLSALVMIYVFINVFFINPLILNAVQIITVWDFIQFDLKKSITRESPIFKNLRHSQAKKVILLGSIRYVTADEFVMRQGEEGHEMYMLLTGKVEVYVEEGEHKNVICTLEPGDLVGEMALLGENVRSASVVALEETKLLRIDEKSLTRVKNSYPRIAAELFFNISAILSDRLKEQISSQ